MSDLFLSFVIFFPHAVLRSLTAHSQLTSVSYLCVCLSVCASFAGYENQDWYISTPALDPDAEIDLSPETIEGTLAYFVLSGERVSQMTKTYNDIDAVTRLLEEVS